MAESSGTSTTDRIGKRRSAEAAVENLPAGAAQFLVAYNVRRSKSPQVELEYGPDGPVDPTYVLSLRRLFREEWRRLDPDVGARTDFFVLEGVTRYATVGFPSGDRTMLREAIRRAMREYLVDGRDEPVGVRTTDAECEMRISIVPSRIIDRYCELWKRGVEGSSAGMWNQALVPDSRYEEEPGMDIPPQRREGAKDDLVSLDELMEQVSALDARLTAAQRPIQSDLQKLLGRLAGRSFGSLEANVAAADALRFLMLRLEVRVECPRDGCQEAALIRCRPAGGTRHGSFEFEHRRNGRLSTHAASTRLPALTLVPAPPHRRRKPKSSGK